MANSQARRLEMNYGRRPQVLGLVAFILLCALAGGLGSIATTPNIPGWYASLVKPSFNPPNGLFPVVWTILYILMAVAAWLVWRERYKSPGGVMAARGNRALVPFFIQLVLNVAWSFAFFGARNPLVGLVVIVLLLIAILRTIFVFWAISRVAGVLLLPYLAWVAFAAVLNLAIYLLN